MGSRTPGRLIGFVRRLVPPPAADSDADLLDRYVRHRDETAFEAVVRRHGPMVFAVCRRRLGDTPDADDAFQATFVLLARDAGKIGRRESLPGWLYRVAYRVALKAAGRAARRAAVPLLPDEAVMTDRPPDSAAGNEELKAVLDAELAALPDRFRSVVVLCLVEGRTNREAAAVLGVPVGTVDSRLSTARKTLQGRLVRRGVAVAATAGFEAALLRATVAGAALHELMATTVGLATGGPDGISPSILELAYGVSTMTSVKAKLLAAGLIAAGVLGGTGAGVFLAAGDGLQKDKPPATEAKQPAGRKTNEVRGTTGAGGAFARTVEVEGAAAVLDRPSKVADNQWTMDDVFQQIGENHKVVVRVDVAAFRRLGVLEERGSNAAQFLSEFRELKPVMPRQPENLTVREVLDHVLAQASVRCAFQVRGSQIVIVPAYVPPNRPGEKDGEVSLAISGQQIAEQMWGPPVGLTVSEKPLAAVLDDLRRQTGANIVLDVRCTDKAAQPVAAAMTDVRLLAALRVLADMADLDAVWMNNVYYLTTPDNAASIKMRVERELFGIQPKPRGSDRGRAGESKK